MDSLVADAKAAKEQEAEVKSKQETEKQEALDAEVKSLKEENESLKTEIADLKSKLEEPVMAGAVEAEVKSEPAKEENTSLGFEAYI